MIYRIGDRIDYFTLDKKIVSGYISKISDCGLVYHVYRSECIMPPDVVHQNRVADIAKYENMVDWLISL